MNPGDDFGNAFSHDVVYPEHPFVDAVDFQIDGVHRTSPIVVHHLAICEGIQHVLKQRAIPLLAEPSLLLGPLALGDIHVGTAVAHQFAAIVENRNSAGGYPNYPAILALHGVVQIAERPLPREDFERRRPKRIASLFGMDVVEVLPAGQFLRPIAPDLLRHRTDIGE